MFNIFQHISTSRNGAPVLRMYSFSADPTARSGRVSECTLQMCFPRNFMHGSSTATDAVELRYECTIACQSANVGFFMVRTSWTWSSPPTVPLAGLQQWPQKRRLVIQPQPGPTWSNLVQDISCYWGCCFADQPRGTGNHWNRMAYRHLTISHDISRYLTISHAECEMRRIDGYLMRIGSNRYWLGGKTGIRLSRREDRSYIRRKQRKTQRKSM